MYDILERLFSGEGVLEDELISAYNVREAMNQAELADMSEEEFMEAIEELEKEDLIETEECNFTVKPLKKFKIKKGSQLNFC